MHSSGSYVFSNAVFDVLDYNKMFHDIQYTADLPELDNRHTWIDQALSPPFWWPYELIFFQKDLITGRIIIFSHF